MFTKCYFAWVVKLIMTDEGEMEEKLRKPGNNQFVVVLMKTDNWHLGRRTDTIYAKATPPD